MINKLFRLDFNQGHAIAHNAISLIPKIDGIVILDLYTFGNNGERIDLINSSISINKPTIIKYDLLVSSSVFIDVSNIYAEDLEISDMISVAVSTTNNNDFGTVVYKETKMSFHEYLSVKYSIENSQDSFINLKLGLKCYDRFGNLQSVDTVILGLNDDNFLIKKQTGGQSITLDYEPLLSSVSVIINGQYTKEFTINGNDVIIDIPDQVDCYVIYQPAYIQTGEFVKISENISINANNEIKFLYTYSDYIQYIAELEIVNTNISNSNSSPVIKNISLITSDR